MNILANLIAFLLPIGLFIYFGILGTATLTILRSQRNLLQNLLLSPVIGVAFTLLPVFLLNRIGLPVKDFATLLTLGLFLSSLIIILYRKPIIPLARYGSFAFIFFLALFLTGRPLLHFGFNWLSYVNDDMANYCLGAVRFLNHGYFDAPSLTEMMKGKDYSQYYWFTFIPAMIRSGSELFLAWLSGLIHRNPVQIFMPLILCFHLVLISSIAALVMVSKKYKAIALIASLFLACSALTTLGTLYQLIAQVLGLSILIAIGVLIQQMFTTTIKYRVFRQSILLSVLTSTLLLSYPEIAPILFLSFIVYFSISLFSGWRPTKTFFLLILFCLIESAIFLNIYWINITAFLHYQITADLAHSKGSLFPYFLIPSGVADLWGLQPLAMIPREPVASLTILMGFLFTALTIILLLKQAVKRYFPAIISLVMIFLGIYLYIGTKEQSGFGLFKLAMYIQPFIFAVLAAGIVELISSRSKKAISIAFIAIMGISIQFSYLYASYGNVGQPYNELPLASRTHMPLELSRLRDKIPAESTIISEAICVVPAKLQAAFLADKNVQFPSSNIFFFPFSGGEIFKQTSPNAYKLASHLTSELLNNNLKVPFLIQNSDKEPLVSYFYKTSSALSVNEPLLLMETPLRSVFNRSQMVEGNNENYTVSPLSSISNHLIFINSTLGQNYYLGESSHISLYGLEKDYFYPQSTVASIGRYLLFQIINPSKKYRLIFDITETLNHNGKNTLPSAKILGDKEYQLPFVGRGSARVISTEFTSRTIDGDSYFMIDLGTEGEVKQKSRAGLMKLYGVDIPVGYRLYVGHARNISLISEQEYEQLTPPSYITQFPNDLKNSNLEYSGIYEDGWFSEDVSLKLAQLHPTNKLTIQGLLPATFSQEKATMLMTVYVDNEKIAVKQINPGPFRFQLDVPNGSVKRNVQLRFNHGFLPSKYDDRLVAVKMDLIGFKPKDIGRHYKVPSYVNDFKSAFENKKFEYSGIYEDGWFSKNAYLKLAQRTGQKQLVIDGFLPKQKQTVSTVLSVYVDNLKVTETSIQPGPIKLAMNIPEGITTRNIQFEFNNDFSISKRDNRVISFKVNELGFR